MDTSVTESETIDLSNILAPWQRRGTFNFHNTGVSLPHYFPPGETDESGLPIIVFPKRPADVIAGRTYKFTMTETKTGLYVVDEVTYRVAHATELEEIGDNVASLADKHFHRSCGPGGQVTLGDTPAGAALLALRQRLTVDAA